MSQSLIKTFDKLSQTYHNKFTHDPLEKQKIQSLVNSWKIEPGSQVLEVGSGTGDLSPFLLEKIGQAGQLTLLDISPEMIKVSKKKLAKYQNLKFVTADIHNVNLKSEFDRIIVFNTFPHFLDKKLAFTNCFHHLKKNGKLIICHNQSRTTILTCHKKKIIDNDISEFTDNQILLKILEDIGYFVETFENNEGYDFYLVIAKK